MKEQNIIDVRQLYKEPYCARNNCLCKKTGSNADREYVYLCNFLPYIVQQIITDNEDGTSSLKLVVGGFDARGKPLKEITVSGQEFERLEWFKTRWGCENRMFVAPLAKEHVLSAVYSTASSDNKSIHYSATGWKNIDGKYSFLMPGDETVSVDLDDKLKNYHMVHSPATREDLQTLAEMLNDDFAPPEVILPLIAFTFMSPLHSFMIEAGCEPKCVLMLVGRSGSLKSTLAALMLCFFGQFTSTSLPMSFKDTPASIEFNSFALKDVLTVIDDYHPSVKNDEKAMSSAAQMIARGWGNRSGRGRLTSSCSAMKTKYPRGDAIITAEFSPDVGFSGIARLFSVEMFPGKVDLEILSSFQEKAKDGALQRCMFSYIEWIREYFVDNDSLRFVLEKSYESYRERITKRFNDICVEPHLRIPEDVAAMSVGFELLAQFLFDHGCISETERGVFMKRFEDVMFDLARKQNASIENDRPTKKFLRKLNSLIESGLCCVVNKNEDCTSLPPKCLGYYDDTNYYLFRSQIHKAVKALCESQGESFTVTEDALIKALANEGFINTDKRQYAKNIRIGKETKRLIELPKKYVTEIDNQDGVCI